MNRNCTNCKHQFVHTTEAPCKECRGVDTEYSLWESEKEPVGYVTVPVIRRDSVRALRHNKGKPPLYYLMTFPEAVRGIARVSAYGEAKYERFNYLKGAPASESISCLMRHLLAWYNGEDVDPESGLNHLDAISWNAVRLTDELTRRPELDDRPCKLTEKRPGQYPFPEETTG